MANRFNRAALIWVGALVLTACASSVPSNFQYDTSLRGEQGFVGRADKISAAEALLDAGVVTDPEIALQAALPNSEIDIRTWGLRYFKSDWIRYQVVLDANIERGDMKIKCREVSTETPVGAPTLKELRANDGAALQAQLNKLVAACVAEVTNPPP